MAADLPRTLFLSLLLTGAEVGAQSLVVVPEKTPVVVEVLEDLSSATAVRGQRFAIRLAEPIEQHGAVIIPPGATGQGEVVHSAKPKGAGKPGELILAARHLDWQGVRIPLRGFDAAQVGKGQVVFFRQGSKLMVTSCAVSIGEQRLSSLKPSTYFIHVTEPRTITYTVKAEKQDDLTLEIEPDRTHFVRCTIGMGFFSGRPNLAPSSEDFFNSVRDGLEPLPTVGSGL